MSYYILPKNFNKVVISPDITHDDNIIHISFSLYKYYNDIKKQIIKICLSQSPDCSMNTFDKIIRIINPYEFIFNKVPSSLFSVSKLKPNTNIFYDFFEISNTLNIFDHFKNMNINSLNIGINNIDSINCTEILREEYDDKFYDFKEINNDLYTSIANINFDFIFCELENNYDHVNLYIINFIKIILIILKNQNNNGICIIKVDKLFHKPVTDILYLLSSLYEKMYIIKPNTTNITTYEKYIVCKKFICSENKIELYKNNYNTLRNFLIEYNYDIKNKKINVISLIQENIPLFFTNKIDDINIIIGQQQIDSLNQIVNILKNKNRDEKIESIKKINIQKSVLWCEKFKIPCNKFSERTNIFLPLNNKKEEFEEELEEELEEGLELEQGLQVQVE